MTDTHDDTWRAARIYLHIGAPKTGSTAIQSVCARGRGALLADGVLYPGSLGRTSHQPFAVAMGRLWDKDGLRRAHGVHGPRGVLRLRRDLAAALRREMAETRPHTLIISCENLYTNVRSLRDARRIARFLKPFADRVHVIGCVRRQDHAMFSAWSHSRRIGKSGDFVAPSRFEANGRYDYAGRLAHWKAVFGRENVAAYSFDSINQDAAADFFDWIGIAAPRTPMRRTNASLDEVRGAFMAEMNVHIPRFVDGHLNVARGDLSQAIDDAPVLSGRPVIEPRDARAILSLYETSNRRLADEWRGGAPFFDETAQQVTGREADDRPLDVEDVIAIAARLWRRKQDEVLRLRARLNAAE